MGRAFEYRKATKMARWANMAKTFTKIGREITLAAREGGGDPQYNPRLRIAIQNAKAANMPKANVENAIKKATDPDLSNYEERTFEGYAPHGIAMMIETATDNNNRTVANVRHVFNKYGGSMGNSGSVEFMFERKGVFKIDAEGRDQEELELELIDHGLEEVKRDEEELLLYTDFENYGTLQSALDEMDIEIKEAKLERIPTHYKKLSDEEVEEVIKFIEKMEDDDDVMNVYHNMDMDE